jgi:hypothetical protein
MKLDVIDALNILVLKICLFEPIKRLVDNNQDLRNQYLIERLILNIFIETTIEVLTFQPSIEDDEDNNIDSRSSRDNNNNIDSRGSRDNNNILLFSDFIKVLKGVIRKHSSLSTLEIPSIKISLSDKDRIIGQGDYYYLELSGYYSNGNVIESIIQKILKPLLVMKKNNIKYLSNNNISYNTKTSYKISYEGVEDDKVYAVLTSLIHNAYIKSFKFHGILDNESSFDNSKPNTTVQLCSTRLPLMSMFNVPRFPNDIIIDCRYFLPHVIYKLYQYINNFIQSKNLKSRIIFICPKSNLILLESKEFNHVGCLEMYIITGDRV